MSMTQFLRELALDRRAFLGGLAAGTATAATGSLELLRQKDTKGDLAAAQRLAGLSFSEEELAMAARGAQRMKGSFTALRERGVDFWTAPAWNFDPLPPGAQRPETESTFKLEPGDGTASTADVDLAYASIPELAGLLKHRKVTSRKLTELAIARLKKHDPEIRCVVTLLDAEALAAADRADAEIAAGKWRGLLHGIPYGAKDLFAWPGAPTTFGAAPFKDQVLDFKATILQKLESHGAVLVAKLSLGALAMGDYWFGGRTRNPWNTETGSSGSSAGPAAAAAGGLLPFTIGTETLGSIVSPCTRCSVAGLRPTFGTVSRYGGMPLSWSMDKVGPIARHAIDLAIVYDAIRGTDGKDTMLRDASMQWPSPDKIEGMRVGVLASRRGNLGDHALVQWLRENGAKTRTVELPRFPYNSIRSILTVEGATAFDDLTRSEGIRKLTRQTAGSWPNQFRSARFVPAVEFLRATRARTQLIAEMAKTMKGVDILVASRGGTSLTCTNFTGHPTVVMPTGKGRGQPSSLTIIGQLYAESTLLGVAHAWQQATKFHLGRPLA